MKRSDAHLVEMLRERTKRNNEAFLVAVADFYDSARFSDSRPAFEAEYESCSQDESFSVEGNDAAECGALGFYLFCHHAERWGTTRDAADQTRADALLGDPRVRSFLFDLYEINEEFREQHLALHAAGTTSFIIKTGYFQNRYHRVIKIIKPWYLSDPVIATQTEESQELYDRELSHVTFRNQPISPIIESTNRQCIIMEFVKGETLHQYFAGLWNRTDANSSESRADSYAALNRIMRSLCGIMNKCHHDLIAHGDLSTTNILVESADGEFPRLRLIDFGINYLLTRNLGRIDHAPSVIATIDPDVMRRKYEAVPSVKGDVYSLGVILIEGFLGDRFRVDSMQVLLDEVYEKHPGVGAVLDDFLDPIPSRRLLDVPAGDNPYEAIAARIDFELRAAASLARVEASSWINALQEMLESIIPGMKDIITLIARTRRSGKTPKNVLEMESEPQLALPVLERADLWVPVTLNFLTVTFVIGRVAPWDAIIQGDAHFSAALSSDWPVWFVVLASSLVASRYFVSIFAGMVTKGLPRPLVLTTMLCAFTPWIPLLLILFRFTDEWLILVAAGSTVVVANNGLWCWFCRSALRSIEGPETHASPLMHGTAFMLRGWIETSAITLVCVYAVAILASQDILHDVTFYAILIAGVICPVVYFVNLRKDAPRIRTGLQRFSNAYRRARAAAEISDNVGQPVLQVRKSNL